MKGLSVYLRKDGRWEGRITIESDNGKRKYKAFFGKTEHDVMQKIIDYRDNTDKPEVKHNVQFNTAFKEWLDSITYRVKESTLANYTLKADKHILPIFGGQNIAEITHNSVYQFIREKQDSGLSNRYITDILILMKSVFKYAARTYGIVNPMDGLIMPKKQKTEIRLLTSAEEQQLMQIISEKSLLAQCC